MIEERATAISFRSGLFIYPSSTRGWKNSVELSLSEWHLKNANISRLSWYYSCIFSNEISRPERSTASRRDETSFILNNNNNNNSNKKANKITSSTHNIWKTRIKHRQLFIINIFFKKQLWRHIRNNEEEVIHIAPLFYVYMGDFRNGFIVSIYGPWCNYWWHLFWELREKWWICAKINTSRWNGSPLERNWPWHNKQTDRRGLDKWRRSRQQLVKWMNESGHVLIYSP